MWSNQHMKRFNEIFNELDMDRSGFIPVYELPNVMKELGQEFYTEDDYNETLVHFDLYPDTPMNRIQCVTFVQHKFRDPTLQLFMEFDKDHDGFVTPTEFRELMANIWEPVSDELATQMMTTADLDGDGKLSYEELKIFLRKCEAEGARLRLL